MGGALPLEDLLHLIHAAGFQGIIPLIDEVTEEYAHKWGFGMDLTQYIQRGLFIGQKPAPSDDEY